MEPTPSFDLDDPLTIDPDPEICRALGYRVIDQLVARRSELKRSPVHGRAERKALDELLGTSLPIVDMEPTEVLRLVEDVVLPANTSTDHPRFFGYVPGPSSFVGVLADAISAGHNVFAGHALVGAGAAAVEAQVLSWLRTIMGLPQTASGLFVSGGSVGNLTAIHTARTKHIGKHAPHDPLLVAYGSEQSHASLAKALRILGFAPRQMRLVQTDAQHRMIPDRLDACIAEDRAAGLTPFLVMATAGSTSVGAVDPLEALRQRCDEHQLWLHVDGAYGAAAILDPTSKELFSELARADSLVLDPHKWWFVPYEAGVVFVRNGLDLRSAFSTEAGYLREAAAAGGRTDEADPLSGLVNFFEYGPQLTRSFRALKLWMVMKTLGSRRLGHLVSRGIRLAQAAEDFIADSPVWEVVTPASIGVVTFRPTITRLASAETLMVAVRSALDEGFALITTAEVDSETVLRLCPIHPEATLDDIKQSLERLENALTQIE